MTEAAAVPPTKKSLLNRLVRRIQRLNGQASLATALLMRATRGLNRPGLVYHVREGRSREISLNRLMSLRGAGRGRRCVIVGTAPSLKTVNLEQASRDFVFALNRSREISTLLGRKVDALVMADQNAIRERGRVAVAYADRVFLSASAVEKSGFRPASAIVFQQWSYPRMDYGFFQFDARRPLYQSRSVAHSALQLAVWMGFEEIVFVGVDFSYGLGDAHFYETKDEELVRTAVVGTKNAKIMALALERAREILSGTSDFSVSVFNAGDQRGRNPFPYRAWNELYPAQVTEHDLRVPREPVSL